MHNFSCFLFVFIAKFSLANQTKNHMKRKKKFFINYYLYYLMHKNCAAQLYACKIHNYLLMALAKHNWLSSCDLNDNSNSSGNGNGIMNTKWKYMHFMGISLYKNESFATFFCFRYSHLICWILCKTAHKFMWKIKNDLNIKHSAFTFA